MKKITLVICCLVFVTFSFSQKNEKLIELELIIKFKAAKNSSIKEGNIYHTFKDATLNELNKINNIESVTLTGNKKQHNTYVLKLNSTNTITDIVNKYQNTGLFEYVEQNFKGTGHGVQITPNDTKFGHQWYHYNDGSFSLSNATNDADIDTDLAWNITQGNPNLIVAILDSGLKLDHAEFSGRIWTNTSEILNGLDSDANNYIDDINGGWDFANNDNDPSDDNGHGTNVAGIALASGNNSVGFAGMNWNSKIMICKILDGNNTGSYSWWAEAIYYAVDNGASVINMSVGGNEASILLEDALNYAYANNVSVIVSAGNQNSIIQYPAKYDNAMAIGSTDPDDTRTVPFYWDELSGSNFGPELDFVAPGNYIYGLHHRSDNNYNSYWGGTSQASPLVTGLISLLLSVSPNLTVDQIRTILIGSSEDQVGGLEDTVGWDVYFGHGRINAYQALLNPTLYVNTVENTQDNIVIHPNPIQSDIPLEISNLTEGKYQISIYNPLGQTLFSMEATANNSEISLELPDFNTGAYFLRIRNELQNISISKKLIIK